MEWKNPLANRILNNDADQFTSDFSIRFRRFIHPLVRSMIHIAVDRPVEVIQYPKLDKKTAYIFCAGHSFPGEAASNLSVIKHNAWVLFGTTDQIKHNPQVIIAWMNGLIYVNRLDKNSRKESMSKMKRILLAGSSVLMFPEGQLNNSENQLCTPVFPGFYHLSNDTGIKCVPIVSHAAHGTKKILVAAGGPMDFSRSSKEKAMNEMRDALASLRYQLIECLPKLDRSSLTGDIHLQHLQKRRDTYLETKWSEPNWDEEIMTYKNKRITYAEDVRASFDKVSITTSNANILSSIFIQRDLDKIYDINQFMKDHWRD